MGGNSAAGEHGGAAHVPVEFLTPGGIAGAARLATTRARTTQPYSHSSVACAPRGASAARGRPARPHPIPGSVHAPCSRQPPSAVKANLPPATAVTPADFVFDCRIEIAGSAGKVAERSLSQSGARLFTHRGQFFNRRDAWQFR